MEVTVQQGIQHIVAVLEELLQVLLDAGAQFSAPILCLQGCIPSEVVNTASLQYLQQVVPSAFRVMNECPAYDLEIQTSFPLQKQHKNIVNMHEKQHWLV